MVSEQNQLHWETDMRCLNTPFFEALPGGVAVRFRMQVRSHKRRRINKKWRKRFGVAEFSLSVESIRDGSWRQALREVMTTARLINHARRMGPDAAARLGIYPLEV